MGMDPVSWAVIGAAALGAGSQYVAAQKQAKATNAATAASTAAAKKAQQQAEMEMNAANAKTASASALQSKNEQAAKGGVSSTMLTGTQGVDPSTLTLGKSTLLGS